MTYDELIKTLVQSTTDEWLHSDEKGIHTFKPNLDITIVEVRPEKDSAFHEEWASAFPDKSAYRFPVELWYRGSFVKGYLLVTVDGHRARLPLPAPNTKNITREKYAIAQAVDVGGSLDEYLSTVGFRIVE